jgi:high-affinity nickel permease
MIALGLGLVSGVRHATDPDHVLAMTQLARPGTNAFTASKTALSWGLGHSVTVMALGSAFIATGTAIPERAATVAQLAVAGKLVALAVGAHWLNLHRFRQATACCAPDQATTVDAQSRPLL